VGVFSEHSVYITSYTNLLQPLLQIFNYLVCTLYTTASDIWLPLCQTIVITSAEMSHNRWHQSVCQRHRHTTTIHSNKPSVHLSIHCMTHMLSAAWSICQLQLSQSW